MKTEVGELFEELSKLDRVEAIALGGSRATEKSDERSDYDVYVYWTEEVPDEVREKILQKYCSRMEIGNHYWEKEDNCTLKDGIDLDIIYRSMDDFMAGIENVVTEGNASNGYTTCMWHNLKTCKILYDEKGRLSAYQKQYEIPYPKRLKENIICKNMNLLSGCLPSYDGQIKKAYIRKDHNSINHRVTEFLASYFDVIFAVNELTHPGEKRLVQLCREQCGILPEHFEENMEKLFAAMFQGNVCEVIDEMVREIKKIVPIGYE